MLYLTVAVIMLQMNSTGGLVEGPLINKEEPLIHTEPLIELIWLVTAGRIIHDIKVFFIVPLYGVTSIAKDCIIESVTAT